MAMQTIPKQMDAKQCVAKSNNAGDQAQSRASAHGSKSCSVKLWRCNLAARIGLHHQGFTEKVLTRMREVMNQNTMHSKVKQCIAM